jgi:3,5-epimerase/4-reductase
MTKFLLYGAKGWIGGQVNSILKQQGIETVLGQSRVDNLNHVEVEIKEHQPTHIISTVGRTHGTHDGEYYPTIDYLEKDGRLVDNLRDNLYSPLLLVSLCQKYNVHLTYLGTGCIFDYDNEHSIENLNGYTEKDSPNFFGSSYSVVKGFTDRLMHLFEDSVLNIRIRMPISGDRSGRNFISKITEYEKICNMPNSMTVLPELLPIMVDMAKQKLNGTINLTNPGLISHNEILEMYREIVDPEFTWKNFTIEEQDQILLAKRSNNFLDTSKLKKLYPEVNDIKTAVRKALESMISTSQENYTTQN